MSVARHSRELSRVAIEYMNGIFTADQLFATIPTDGYKGDIGMVDPTVFNAEEDDGPREDNAPSTELSWGTSTTDYKLGKYNHNIFVPDQSMLTTVATLQRRERYTRQATERLLLKREIRAATLGEADGSFSQSQAVGTKWNADGGDPVQDILDAKETVRGKIGRKANTVHMPENVWTKVRQIESVRQLMGANQSGLVSRAQFAGYIEIPAANFIIGESVKNTANENQAQSLSDVWSDNVQVVYNNPGLEGMVWGAYFVPREANRRRWVRTRREDDPEGTRVYVDMYYQFKVIVSDAGVQLKDVL